MDLSSKVSGVNDIVYAMDHLPRAMQNKALRPALRAGGDIVKARAIANVRRVAVKGYSTGKLARSIVARNARMKGRALRVIISVAAGRTYPDGTRVGLAGSVLEHGKAGQAPAPWLRPAIRESESAVYSVILSTARPRLAAAVAEARR